MNLTMGEVLRQLRRQQGMTQTELGGVQFSKSYVSAVEHDKIVPSYEALRHFSRQLGQDTNYFEQFLPQSKANVSLFSPSLSSSYHDDPMLGNALNSLDALGEGGALPDQYFMEEVAVLPSDVLGSLSKEQQTAYLFWMGYRARQQGNSIEALSAYESALGIASLKYQPVILDELGTCHALSSAYHLALNAHSRALNLLEVGTEKLKSSSLRLRVELHCAQDYQALGQHSRALIHYKHARGLLQGHSDVKKAAQIYDGLGYCTYAALFQEEHVSSFQTQAEIVYQQAIDYLVQACTLYSIGNEQKEGSKTRLTQVMILLDDCTRRRRGIQQYSIESASTEIVRCVALLEKVEEQCRQILILEQEEKTLSEILPEEGQSRLLLLLAALLSVFVQRALLAIENKERHAFKVAQSQALWFCQQTLPALATDTLSWTRLQEIMNAVSSDGKQVEAVIPSLPPLRLPTLQESQAELSLEVGMLAELLAGMATTENTRDDFFLRADDLFHNALSLWNAARQKHPDGTLLRRGYQHVINTLEERKAAHPAQSEQYVQTLLNLFSIP